MGLVYQKDSGYLIHGIHPQTWKDFVDEFGHTPHRQELISGLELAISHLKDCGCKKIYIDGSFVSKKHRPNDYDACWDEIGVDIKKMKLLYPTLTDFSRNRLYQKLYYKGELFPMTTIAHPITKEIYLDFFQHDKNNIPKGIVEINI